MAHGFEDVLFVLLLIAVGIVAAYVGGLFGVGGGTVLVPFFITIFPFFHTSHEMLMHMAIGTSLALLIPNTFMAARKQYRMGNLDFTLLKRWLPFVIIGCLMGVSAVKFIPTTYLKVIFTIYLYLSFTFVAMKKIKESDSEKKPEGFWMSIFAALIGAFSVLLGIGGGPFTVPVCQLYDYPLRKAIAISSATGFLIGIIGTVGVIVSGWGVPGRTPYSLGFINLVAFAVIVPSILLFSHQGVVTANKLSKKTLKRLYSIFLLVMALYMTSQIFYAY